MVQSARCGYLVHITYLVKEVFYMAEDVLVVASKVRVYLKGRGVKMSGDMVGALNGKVKGLLDAAASRAQANKRATVKPQDV